MRFKRLLALLVSAALALSLLAGCGGSKALSQVIVDLLDGLYSNVSVEADSDLTAALKQAAAEGGTEEEILSRMIEILNLNGGSITFTRLGSGQQGDHAVTLYFQTGTDPDAAARNALAQWAGVLGTLPDDGSYQGDVAMIETENGYYIALDVEVLKAGKADKPDKDDDDNQDDGLIHADGMAYDPDQGSATISGENGLTSLVDTLQKVADESGTTLAEAIGETDITLTSSTTLPADWPYEATYEATFDGGNNIVSGVSSSNENGFNGMFSTLTGTVKNVQFEAVEIDGGSGENGNFNGAVAGFNDGGTVENCVVLSGTISGNESTGALVGWNSGEIKNCKSAATVNGSASNTGGIAGYNDGEITECESAATVNGSSYSTGGIVGQNQGTVSDSTNSGLVTNTNSAVDACGGIVGYNGGLISNSTNTGSVESAGWSVGGIAGTNGETSTISGCTSSGSVQGEQDAVGGIVGSNYGIITDSSFQSSVTGAFLVGGIAGVNDPGMYNGPCQITRSYVKGTVQGTHSSSGGVGGIVGSSTGKIEACYAIGNVSSPSSAGWVGGVAGEVNNNGTISGCYFSGTVSGTQNVGGVAGKDSYNTSIQGCYAILSGDASAYGVIGAYNTGFVVQGTVNACYWSGTAIGGTHSGIHQVTDWADATKAMNDACGGLYDTSGTGAPKLTWE